MLASFSRRNLLGVTAVAIGTFATPAIAAGAGGFPGIDETYVAIPISKAQFIPEGDSLKVVVDVTREQSKKLTSEKQAIL